MSSHIIQSLAESGSRFSLRVEQEVRATHGKVAGGEGADPAACKLS